MLSRLGNQSEAQIVQRRQIVKQYAVFPVGHLDLDSDLGSDFPQHLRPAVFLSAQTKRTGNPVRISQKAVENPVCGVVVLIPQECDLSAADRKRQRCHGGKQQVGDAEYLCPSLSVRRILPFGHAAPVLPSENLIQSFVVFLRIEMITQLAVFDHIHPSGIAVHKPLVQIQQEHRAPLPEQQLNAVHEHLQIPLPEDLGDAVEHNQPDTGKPCLVERELIVIQQGQCSELFLPAKADSHLLPDRLRFRRADPPVRLPVLFPAHGLSERNDIILRRQLLGGKAMLAHDHAVLADPPSDLRRTDTASAAERLAGFHHGRPVEYPEISGSGRQMLVDIDADALAPSNRDIKPIAPALVLKPSVFDAYQFFFHRSTSSNCSGRVTQHSVPTPRALKMRRP